MGEQPRDWDRELAEIDKLLGAGPAPSAPGKPVPIPKAGRVPPAPGMAPRVGAAGRYAVLFTWIRLGLGLVLGAAITQWPYTHGCGLPLVGYLGAVAVVLAAGVWSGVSSWKTRSGLAHFLSVGLILWGGVLGAREVLPRVGYAKQSATWVCAAPAVEVPRP